MSDSTPTPPAPAPAPQPSKRSRSPIDKKLTAELELAGQLVATAQKTAYATALAGEEIDAAFLTNLTGKIGEAGILIGSASSDNADKETATLAEQAAQKALLGQISKVQKRAKRKYNLGDPGRKKYLIGENIDASRSMLETSAQSIVTILGTDTLPGHKTADTIALSTALQTFKDSKTTQVGGEGDARTDYALLTAKVKEIAGLRRQIQYAADTLWPPGDPNNAGIRKEFQIPLTKALK